MRLQPLGHLSSVRILNGFRLKRNIRNNPSPTLDTPICWLLKLGMPPTIPVTIKLKPRIVLPTAAIRQLTQIGQKNQREALTLSPHEWSAICKECAIVPQLRSLLAPIRSHASAWQSEIVRRSNFSISGPTVEFQPESSYATHPHFFKLSMVCALLLNADAFNGATHHFSSILVDYYSNFRPSCFSRFHQDSYWKSCILDVSGNQDGH